MFILNAKTVKKLNGKKLSTLVKNYNFNIIDFLDDNCEEMSNEAYNLLKNNKAELIMLKNDPNYDFILKVDNFEAYCIFDYF